MTAKNDITGDPIRSKTGGSAFSKGYDNIDWSIKEPTVQPDPGHYESFDWDEKRIDTIGQNGNDGLHYLLDREGQTWMYLPAESDPAEASNYIAKECVWVSFIIVAVVTLIAFLAWGN